MNNFKHYTFQELAPLKKMVPKALLTIIRGVKIPVEGINMSAQFQNVHIDKTQLIVYNKFFGFTHEFPLSYLYLLAQRVQAALMLQKQYSMKIPGTVHLTNNLELIQKININLPFTIEAQIVVPYKKEGSLKPEISIKFYQNQELVAFCDSLYLVKRKSVGTSENKREFPVPFQVPTKNYIWNFHKNIGKEYAKVSDDHNPIHKSKIAARLLGLKKPIAHGWYMVSKAAQLFEREQHSPIRKITCSFSTPAFLPGNYVYQTRENNFQILNSSGSKVITSGMIFPTIP